jgi:hypothetical protein
MPIAHRPNHPRGKATISAIEEKFAALKVCMAGKPSASAPAASADAAMSTVSNATSPIGAVSGGVIDVYF